MRKYVVRKHVNQYHAIGKEGFAIWEEFADSLGGVCLIRIERYRENADDYSHMLNEAYRLGCEDEKRKWEESPAGPAVVEEPLCPVTVGEARLVAQQIREATWADKQYWPFIIEELCRRLDNRKEP